jgi:hypothetical protein
VRSSPEEEDNRSNRTESVEVGTECAGRSADEPLLTLDHRLNLSLTLDLRVRLWRVASDANFLQ